MKKTLLHVLALLAVQTAGAATVNNLEDSGPGSLRDTIATAAANDIIDFSVTGTITLTSGQIVISNHLAIIGPAGFLAIDGSHNNDRLFSIAPGSSVSMSGLICANGTALVYAYGDSSDSASGGAINNLGSLTVINCAFSGNSASDNSAGEVGSLGGAIYNEGTFLAINCTFLLNVASSYPDFRGDNNGYDGGGAIYNYNGHEMTVNNCRFVANQAGDASQGAFGGAIANGGNLTLNDSKFLGNSLSYDAADHGPGAAQGGAIVNSGTLKINHCTFSGNQTADTNGIIGGAVANSGNLAVNGSTFSTNHAGYHGLGGAIYNEHTLTVNNSTFSGNDTTPGYGGGIYSASPGSFSFSTNPVSSSLLAVTNSTFSGNSSGQGFNAGQGGGIYIGPGDTNTALYNNIIAGNDAHHGPDVYGVVTNTSHNLIGAVDESSGWAASDLKGMDPRLGPLRDNGGPTFTMSLQPGSPAIDAGDDSVLGALATDQRGRPRKLGPHMDIGAVEIGQITVAVSHLDDSGPGSLRAAIADASLVEGDTIKLDPNLTGVMTLTSGELVLDKSVNIIGPGANLLTLSGNNSTRVFHATSCTNLIANLRIADGRTNGGGGGIALEGGCLTISNCTITGCYAGGADVASEGGGAVAVVGPANLTIISSTLSGNSTPFYGGGLHLFNANASLVNSTVSGNRTFDGSNDDAWGGGIFVYNSTLTVTNSTIANNSSLSAGGGIFRYSGNATVAGGLIAYNTAPTGPDCKGTFISGGYNLIGNSSGSAGFGQVADQLDVDPMIGPLADNGGPTFTHALLAGSPAIDQGKSFGLPTDQRGQLRPLDFPNIANVTNADGADIGAFEAQSVAGQYQLVNLGTLGGPFQNESEAYGVNNSGVIVGYSYLAPSQPRAVYWANINSPAVNVGVSGGYDQSYAWKINDSGAVVGWSTLRDDGHTHATYWPGAGDLGTFHGGANSLAYGINANGQIVGDAEGYNPDAGNPYYSYAAYWGTGSSSPLRIGPSVSGTRAYAINDSGQIVGVGSAGGAVLALGGSEQALLEPPDGLGGTVASGINNSGQIIGYYESDISFNYHALFWPNAFGAPVQLASLPGSILDLPESINASGQIVGGSGGNAIGGPIGGLPGGHAVLWRNSTSAPIDLNTVIPANSGSVLNMAYGINDSGEIVGRGLVDGVPFAFALIPLAATSPSGTIVAVNTSTPIPGGTGNFTSLLRGPSFDGTSLAFLGGGSGGQQGIYLQGRSAFSAPVKIADLNTLIPNGAGSFLSFLGEPQPPTPPDPCVSGNNVTFYGTGSGGQRGIYVSWSGTLSSVADTQTAIPGGIGNFIGFAPPGTPPDPCISGGNVVFHGEGAGGQSGVYAQINGALVNIADTATAIPGGTGDFIAFPPDPCISGASVLFGGSGSGGQQGVYLWKAGVLSVIADTATAWPGGAGNITTFPVDPWLSGDTAAFVATGTGGQMGVFVKHPQDPIKQVADLQTTIPNGIGSFHGFGAVSVSATDVAFLGTGPGGQMGIYDQTGGQLVKVVAVGDTLGGKTITGLSFTRTGLSGDPVAFQAAFADGSQGLFTRNVVAPPFAPHIDAEKLGDDLRISFTSEGGHTYNVLTTPDLLSGAWSALQTGITGNGATVQVIIPNVIVQPRQFYRIQQAQ